MQFPEAKFFYKHCRDVVTVDSCGDFLCAGASDNSVLCLGEEQGVLVSDVCCNRYNEVSITLNFEMRKELSYGNAALLIRPMPFLSTWPMVLIIQ